MRLRRAVKCTVHLLLRGVLRALRMWELLYNPTWYLKLCGVMSERILKVDDKGRILLPIDVRRRLGIKRAVKARVEDDKVILVPVEDPLNSLLKIVVKGVEDVEKEIEELRRASERALAREAE